VGRGPLGPAPVGRPPVVSRGPAARPQKPGVSAKSGQQDRLAKVRELDRSKRKAAKRQLNAEVRRFTQRARTRVAVLATVGASVLALVGLVLATMYTPLLAIEKIDITGTDRLKVKSVRNAVIGLIGTPLTMVDEAQIAQRLASFSLIESFSTISLPPHTLEIHILERQPIAIVTVNGADYLYDPAGVQIGLAKNYGKYPRVLINGSPLHNSNYRAAIDVILALPLDLLPRVASVQATSKDDVRIRLRGLAGQQVLWGDSSMSTLKSKVLAALIANTKKSATATFDVSSPKAPTVRYGNF